MSKAAKSINYHIAQGDYQANSTSVKDALAFEAELKVLAKTNNDAKTLLASLKEIKDSQKKGFKQKIGMVGSFNIPQNPKAVQAVQKAHAAAMKQYQNDYAAWQAQCAQIKASAGVPKYKSLTDQVHQKINAEGGDASFVSSAQNSQGGDSWNSKACKMKVVELNLRGIKTIDEAEKQGMFCGLGFRRDNLKEAFEYYRKIPNELKRDMKSVAIYKGAVCQFLEQTTADNIDHNERTIITVRTEDGDKIPGLKGAIPNTEVKYNISCSESTAHGKIYSYLGDRAIVTKVPFSRVMGCYWWEGIKGSNHGPYAGDHEQEIVCDTFGSPYKKFFAGTVNDLGTDKSAYDKAVQMYRDYIKKHGDKI